MTEVYKDLLNYLTTLSEESGNPLRIVWDNRERESTEIQRLAPRLGRHLPQGRRNVQESTLVNSGGLDLSSLGLTGTAKLMLLDGTDQTQFSIVVEESDNKFTEAVDFALHGFSKPKLRRDGKVAEALGGPHLTLQAVALQHLSELTGSENAQGLIKTDEKGITINDRFRLELRPGRDIHGKLTKLPK